MNDDSTLGRAVAYTYDSTIPSYRHNYLDRICRWISQEWYGVDKDFVFERTEGYTVVEFRYTFNGRLVDEIALFNASGIYLGLAIV